MKNKLWLLQTPIIILSAFAIFAISETGHKTITNDHIQKVISAPLINISNFFLDLKFHLRGPQPPKNSKIVILDIDNASLQAVGRWPWHRHVMAELIEKTFKAKAKLIGLDMVFSEEDIRVSNELFNELTKLNLGYLKAQFETDPLLAKTISEHSDKIVLGWTPQGSCPPRLSVPERCPLINQASEVEYPENFEKFSIKYQIPKSVPVAESALFSSYDTLANLNIFNAVAKHSGFFQTYPDPDGTIRRSPVIQMLNGKAYPSLALKMALLIQNEELRASFNKDGRLEKLLYENSKKELQANSTGFIEFNSRGPGYTFPYVSAIDVLAIGENVEGVQLEQSLNAAEKLKDAYVLIGLSALGAADLRAFSFDKIVPGVEGHATVLDNLLADDYIRHETTFLTYLLVILGGLFFAYGLQRFGSLQGLTITAIVLILSTVIDYKLLFLRNRDWNLSFFYIEIALIFFLSTVAKYIIEEKDKKFIKNAFSRYISPDFVNMLIADQSKLTLGGEKKILTILFVDIRGFTSFSETVDAKTLSNFLNEYLGLMTDIIFNKKGTLDKYIGDAIMAFWGAPLDIANSATSACEAALKMTDIIRTQNAHFLQAYGLDLQIGIGLNTGSVNVGNMGSIKNFSYTVIGDHVNIASRIESLTKYYGVSLLTTRFTINAIVAEGSKLPYCRTLDLVKVKGKKQIIEVIQLLEADFPNISLSTFNLGHQAYVNKDWDLAINYFTESNSTFKSLKLKDDLPSLLYIKRCQDFLIKPPPDDWNGIWEMSDK